MCVCVCVCVFPHDASLTVWVGVVRGIEWIGLKKILSYGFPALNSSGMARNEIAVTYLDTGNAKATVIFSLLLFHFVSFQILSILIENLPFEGWVV